MFGFDSTLGFVSFAVIVGGGVVYLAYDAWREHKRKYGKDKKD